MNLNVPTSSRRENTRAGRAASSIGPFRAGEITAVNEKLNDEPALVNSSPEEASW